MSSVGGEKAKKKHILVHATILDKKSKVKDCSGLNARIFPDQTVSYGSVTIPQEEGKVNAWYMIKSTDSGLKLSEMFTELPQPDPGTALEKTASCLIDSSLYVYGGRPLKGNPFNGFNRNVGRLDLPNYQQQGWSSCNPFEAEIDHFQPAVFGENIYTFFPNTRYTPAYRGWRDTVFCYIYNTTKQKGFFLEDLPDHRFSPDICVPLEGHGLLIVDIKQSKRFYLLDQNNYACRECKGYKPLPDGLNWRQDSSTYAVLDGMLYILDVSNHPVLDLHAYNCWEGTMLYSVMIPTLVRRVPWFARTQYWSKFRPTHLVAVSSSEFYILWSSEIFIYCARVRVGNTPAGETCAELVEVCYFEIDCHGVRLNNCLAVDADLGEMAEVSNLLEERRREESKQQIEEEKVMAEVSKLLEKRRREEPKQQIEEEKLVVVSKSMPSLRRCCTKPIKKPTKPIKKPVVTRRPFPRMLHHRLSKHLVLLKLAKKMNGEKVAALTRRKLALSKRS